MADSLTPKQRSRNMAAIKSKDTKPEIKVRKFLHGLGYRYRLHDRDLPGKPDIVMKKYKTVIFVNGCYWHRHPGCKFAYQPQSNIEFWGLKFQQNIDRDRRNYTNLEEKGWHVIIIWECAIKNNSYEKKLLKQLER